MHIDSAYVQLAAVCTNLLESYKGVPVTEISRLPTRVVLSTVASSLPLREALPAPAYP